MSETVGERLIKIRERAKISQNEAARRCELSQQAISKLEAGDRLPRWTTLLALAEAYKMTPGALVDELVGADIPAPPTLLALVARHDMTPDEVRRLARAQAGLGVEVSEFDFGLLLQALRRKPTE